MTCEPHQNERPCGDRPTHEWVVFSTALTEGWLMLQCVECGTHGTVEDPSEIEWAKAFHAPSKPYHWSEDARIRVRPVGPFYVARTEHGYERIPREVMGRVIPVTEEEREDLEALAEVVIEGDFDGVLFALFIRSFEQGQGPNVSEPAKRLARRFEQWHSAGHASSPQMVASALRWYAREGARGTMAHQLLEGSNRMGVWSHFKRGDVP